MKYTVVKYEFGLYEKGRIGRHDQTELWYELNVKKDGKKGRGLVEHRAWYTPVFTCHDCKKMGVPKNVRYRSDTVYSPYGRGWIEKSKSINGPYVEGQHILCTGCWNRKRTFVNKIREADDLNRLINQLKKEISNERKNQNDRANARLSGNDDARREERRP